MLIFPMYPNYPLMEYVSSLKNEVDDTVPKRTNDRYVSQNNLRKKRCKCFDIVLGSDGK